LALMGPVDHCPDWFRGLPNVRLLGPVPYEELPQHVAGLDVLLMPYVNDDMIRQSNPLKLRECLASGKPTVIIDVPEARKYEPHVRIGADMKAFLRQIDEALAEPPDSPSIRARQESVRAEGWQTRAETLRGLLVEYAALPEKPAPRP